MTSLKWDRPVVRHADPPTDRTATAPYNFVPLPDEVLIVEGRPEFEPPPWKRYDLFDGLSGTITATLTALTDVFQGAGEASEGGVHLPNLDADGRPFLRGSGLRGVIRNLVEVLSYSRPQPLGGSRLFYRSVQGDRMGKTYGKQLRREPGALPLGGFLRRDERGWYVSPARVLRVPHDLLTGLGYKFDVKYRPSAALNQQPCWIRPGHTGDRVSEGDIELTEPTGGDPWVEGVVVLTGAAPPRNGVHKQHEWVFLPQETSSALRVDDEIVHDVNSRRQLTRYQRDVFKKDLPSIGARPTDGWLRDDEPVFYITSPSDPSTVEFLGRAGLFRLPYPETPATLSPFSPDGGLDLAEALFGIVREGESGCQIAGRVAVFDAPARGSAPTDGWLTPERTVVLLNPGATSFQHYLVQNDPARSQLKTFFTADKVGTAPRGHKFYWHRGDASEAEGSPDVTRTIRSVLNGTVFDVKVTFENLIDVELGALLTALELPEGCALKVGGARPLGFGSVKVDDVQLTLSDASARYRSWAGTGRTSEDSQRFRDAFAALIAKHAACELLPEQSVWDIPRLAELRLLLGWPGPGTETTATMLVGRFKDRPVLPTPSRAVGTPIDHGPEPGPAPTPTGETPQRAPASADRRQHVSKSPKASVLAKGTTHLCVATGPKVGRRTPVVVKGRPELQGVLEDRKEAAGLKSDGALLEVVSVGSETRFKVPS